MNSGKALYWRFGIAGTALLAAIAVYCLARIHPPALLTQFQVTGTPFRDFSGVLGSAPSFLYTLVIGLLIGTCASTRASAKIHCSIWIALALLLEISQHPLIAEAVSSRLDGKLNLSVWELIGPYWNHSVFDPLDLVATVAGGVIAMVILIHSPIGIGNARG